MMDGGLNLSASAPADTLVTTSAGNVGIGTSSSVNGLSVYKSGTQWTGNTVNSYPVPAGNVFLQTPSIASQANWIGMTGNYGATSGSANLLLQANLNNTSQQAGNYIGSEATSATSAVLTFGRMIGAASTGGNATKSEAMRLNSSGYLLVNCTATPSSSVGGVLLANPYDFAPIFSTAPSTGVATAIAFVNGNGTVGAINTSGSNTSYATSSDYRLKDNIAPMTGALDKLSALKPCTYTWKIDGSSGEGFIAHELAEVAPQAVIGQKDDVDGEGNPKYQSIDTSFLVATLTAAIQEQQAIITDLKSRIEALEAK